ncbi:DUF6000 family protein [Streptomyces sp. NPDC102279]|uniref:DUF6000 family protein n=1 Tax=Streptomyces sp. NPDC102279 TaxID=3366153 RepID=UPI003813D8AC
MNPNCLAAESRTEAGGSASQLCFAGQGYCFALACLDTDEDAQHLEVYLDCHL